jgi:hypothetical protein
MCSVAAEVIHCLGTWGEYFGHQGVEGSTEQQLLQVGMVLWMEQKGQTLHGFVSLPFKSHKH